MEEEPIARLADSGAPRTMLSVPFFAAWAGADCLSSAVCGVRAAVPNPAVARPKP